ncbi:MAG: hypothetical protein M1114_06555 [Candidatus Dependentiae bacterium]|nr:hypothetical protein [Candidatus Dependentiae bacterium]
MKKLMILVCIFTVVMPLFGRIEITHRLEELRKKYKYAQDFANTVSVARGVGFGFGGTGTGFLKPLSSEQAEAKAAAMAELNAAVAEANAVVKRVAEEYHAALKEYFIGSQQAQSSKEKQ